MGLAHRGLQHRQAAEVIVERQDGGRARGSGYLVRSGLVLTAAHVVAGAGKVTVRFEADQPGEWTAQAAVVWAGRDIDIDVAVLALIGPAPRARPAAFGSVRKRDAELPCSALGFPLFKYRKKAGRPYRDSFHARGRVALLAGLREGTLEFRVQQPATEPDPTRSAWEGMSGAAVWAYGRIIGVITRQHRTEGSGSLTVTRADRWAQRADQEGQAALRRAGLHPPLRPVAAPWQNRKLLLTGGALLAASAAAGWLASRPAPLHLQITGECTDVGQVLHNRSGGFTPGARYTDEILGPDGQTPPGVSTSGTVDKYGSLRWAWNCSASDQPGTYRVRVTDDATRRRTGWVTFEIKTVRGYSCRITQRGGLRYAGISDTQDAVLSTGSRGPEVAEAQCLLSYLGYELGASGIDGVYGSYTERAVTAVQAREDPATADGVLGPYTWRQLRTLQR